MVLVGLDVLKNLFQPEEFRGSVVGSMRAPRAGELAALLWALLAQQLAARALFAGWVCACWSGQQGSQLDVWHSIEQQCQCVKWHQKHLISLPALRCCLHSINGD